MSLYPLQSINLDVKFSSFLEGLLKKRGYQFIVGKTDWWESDDSCIKYYYRCRAIDQTEISIELLYHENNYPES